MLTVLIRCAVAATFFGWLSLIYLVHELLTIGG